MNEIEKELDTIKRVITSILLELDEKDEQINTILIDNNNDSNKYFGGFLLWIYMEQKPKRT